MFVLYANVCRLFVFVFFCFCFFVGANEMHSQLMVGACCVCICFICLLKVNNLLVFCFIGACVSVLPLDLPALLDVLCRPINHSFIHSLIIKCHGSIDKSDLLTTHDCLVSCRLWLLWYRAIVSTNKSFCIEISFDRCVCGTTGQCCLYRPLLKVRVKHSDWQTTC